MTDTRHDPAMLTPEAILALAPDASAVRGGQGLAKPKGWSGLARDDRALWGEFQGSALYQVRADLSDLTTRCSCPSRKFPCKHGLGLLLLAANDPAAFPVAAPPEWVRDWLTRRDAEAEKRASKQDAASATPDDEDATAAAPPARADKNTARRLSRVNAGLDSLDLWLGDLLRAGLAQAGTQPSVFWEGQAARLTDAQAPGLAGWVRRLATLPNASPDWPARLLADLGRLALLGHAFRHLDSLDTALRDDVRAAIGWSLTQEKVLACGETLRDDWIVLGEIVETEERLRTQRVWLRGAASGRPALILQFAHGAGAFAENFAAGSRFAADLTFWPGALPLRALLRARHGPPERLTTVEGHATLGTFLDCAADALARQPWLERHPAILGDVTPLIAETGEWCVRDREGATLPLARTDHWRLVALAGGSPLTLTAEWDGTALLPLGALVDNAFYRLTEAHAAIAAPRRGSAAHDPLTQAALLGTAQGGLPPAPTNPADALAAAPDATPERRLLLTAGARAIYARAGRLPGDVIAAPEPAATERLPLCPPGVVRLIAGLPGSEYAALLPEALARLAHVGWRLPPALLPEFFTAGARSTALRPALVTVGGERGRWLARQNPAWAWAARATPIGTPVLPPDATTHWEEGGAAERLDLLRAARAADPAQGRDRLAASWAGEKADFRAEAVAALAVGLSARDEVFLDVALTDRSAAVRVAAALLLARLPGSALAARMGERAMPLLAYNPPQRRGFLRAVTLAITGQNTPGALTVTLPDGPDPAWQRDGIEAKPRQGLGERAWWLLRALTHVPPAEWAARFAATPQELIAAAAQGESGAAVIEGWTRAALNVGDSDWLAALWPYWATDRGQAGFHGVATELLGAILTGLPAERVWPLALETLDQGATVDRSAWTTIAPLLPRPWDESLAARYLDALARRVREQRNYDPWLGTLEVAALALPSALFRSAQREWQVHDPNSWWSQRWLHALERFTATIAMRGRIHDEIPL